MMDNKATRSPFVPVSGKIKVPAQKAMTRIEGTITRRIEGVTVLPSDVIAALGDVPPHASLFDIKIEASVGEGGNTSIVTVRFIKETGIVSDDAPNVR